MAKVQIGDREFDIEKFTLNDIINIDEKIGDIRSISKKEKLSEQLKDIRYILWYAIHKKDQKITEEEIGELLEIKNMNDVIQQVFKAVDIQANPIAVPRK